MAGHGRSRLDGKAWIDEEETDELDEFEQRIEEIDADFEAYLSKQVPMDRPSYHPKDEVFLR